MNIDPNKVKELILIYSELDEEYQKKLLGEAYKMQIMLSQKKQIQKEATKYKTEDELQKEIVKRSNKSAKGVLDLVKMLDEVSDTDKAAVFMMINRMARNSDTVQESDISITINQKEISVQEYLEKHFFNVDYDKVKSMVNGFMNDTN